MGSCDLSGTIRTMFLVRDDHLEHLELERRELMQVVVSLLMFCFVRNSVKTIFGDI
jgi:hypothetical protein